jgi:hypothetical protein
MTSRGRRNGFARDKRLFMTASADSYQMITPPLTIRPLTERNSFTGQTQQLAIESPSRDSGAERGAQILKIVQAELPEERLFSFRFLYRKLRSFPICVTIEIAKI